MLASGSTSSLAPAFAWAAAAAAVVPWQWQWRWPCRGGDCGGTVAVEAISFFWQKSEIWRQPRILIG